MAEGSWGCGLLVALRGLVFAEPVGEVLHAADDSSNSSDQHGVGADDAVDGCGFGVV